MNFAPTSSVKEMSIAVAGLTVIAATVAVCQTRVQTSNGRHFAFRHIYVAYGRYLYRLLYRG
jgi:hypothetical protein